MEVDLGNSVFPQLLPVVAGLAVASDALYCAAYGQLDIPPPSSLIITEENGIEDDKKTQQPQQDEPMAISSDDTPIGYSTGSDDFPNPKNQIELYKSPDSIPEMTDVVIPPVPLLNSAKSIPQIPLPSFDNSIPPQPSSARGLGNDLTEESNSRVAVRFFLKKSKRFCGAISFYLSKPTSISGNKFRSLMSQLKKSVTSLANRLPKASTVNQITNTLASTFRNQSLLPKCLKYLGLSMGSNAITFGESGGKALKHHPKRLNKISNENFASQYSAILQASMIATAPIAENQFEFGQDGGKSSDHQFAKPKIYRCEHCKSHYFRLIAYLKHIRRLHPQEILKCESCQKNFSSPNNLRKHQLQCCKRILKI